MSDAKFLEGVSSLIVCDLAEIVEVERAPVDGVQCASDRCWAVPVGLDGVGRQRERSSEDVGARGEVGLGVGEAGADLLPTLGDVREAGADLLARKGRVGEVVEQVVFLRIEPREFLLELLLELSDSLLLVVDGVLERCQQNSPQLVVQPDGCVVSRNF